MYKKIKISLFSSLLAISSLQHVALADVSVNEQKTANYYQTMLSAETLELSRVQLFVNLMPKGGDLHHHYTGSIYAETYLEWVKRNGWYINIDSFRIEKEKSSGNLNIADFMKNKLLLNRLLGTWSTKDFYRYSADKIPPTNQFFRTFKYFSPISDADFEAGLNILKTRAKEENVIYLETMLERVGVKAKYLMEKSARKTFNDALNAATSSEEIDKILDELFDLYAQHDIYQQKVDEYVQRISRYQQLIDDDEFKMRFQTYAVRVLKPAQVFLDLMSGYQAAERSPYVVGVNIVAPEQGQVSLDNYTLHMRMFNYLKRKMPSVESALHAGELVVGLVRPKDLKFHIREAIEIAGAKRIGHGIDIAHESKPLELLQSMQQVAVEICFTSNEFILGVEPKEHPFYLYKEHNVPMVIATDDSGVSRNNLSTEYGLLVSRYKPSYFELKALVFNSIKYSFAAVADKKALNTILVKKFNAFEQKISNLVDAQ